MLALRIFLYVAAMTLMVVGTLFQLERKDKEEYLSIEDQIEYIKESPVETSQMSTDLLESELISD